MPIINKIIITLGLLFIIIPKIYGEEMSQKPIEQDIIKYNTFNTKNANTPELKQKTADVMDELSDLTSTTTTTSNTQAPSAPGGYLSY